MPNQRGADWQTKTAHGRAEPTSGVLEIQCVRMQIPAETHKREVSLLTWPRRPVAPKPPPDADAPGGGEVPKNDRQQGAAQSGSQKTPGQKRKKIQGARAVDYRLLFQPFQIGFDCTSTSGLLFSTVSGWLRLQLRLQTSGRRFQNTPKISRAARGLHSTIQCTV